MSEAAPRATILKAQPIVESMRDSLTARAHSLKAAGIIPRLVIATDNNRGPIAKYISMKQKAGDQIGVIVDVNPMSTQALRSVLHQASTDPGTNGAILQLPVRGHADLHGPKRRTADSQLLAAIKPEKDVDGLVPGSRFSPATPLGIMRLLSYYDPEFASRSITLFGYGQLVNQPLRGMLHAAGARDPNVVDIDTSDRDRQRILYGSSIVISATGHPGSLSLDLLQHCTPKMIIDAGTSEHEGTVHGDVADDARRYVEASEGWSITPPKGGVGPLTVWNLHDNVITAAERMQKAGTAQLAWTSEYMNPGVYTDQLTYPTS